MSKQDEFFVGYLSVPPGLSRFYKLLALSLLFVFIGLGIWLSAAQKSAGLGISDMSVEHEFTGYLTVDPYPVLHVVGEQNRSVILVDQMKKSATDIAKPFANQWVSVSGLSVERGDWLMLQIDPAKGIQKTSAQSHSPPQAEPLGQVSFTGEIIDSKCFLGAMKPGAGKVHRACATLCLMGGIPPMFIVKNKQGQQFGYLLMNKDGSSAAIDLAEDVAVPVNIRGELERRGDMTYLKIDADQITYLEGRALSEYGETLAALSSEAIPDHPIIQ